MILQLKDRFLSPLTWDSYYEHPFGWVGAPEGGGSSDLAKEIRENRQSLEIIGGVVDSTLSYEYDEFALVRYKRKLYLLQTSGCSCPSPTETWGIVHGPVGKRELIKEIKAGNYEGYTLPSHLGEELLQVIDAA